MDLKQIIAGQFEASLSMLRECIEKCPAELWDGLIAKYPFWQVAYHVLCFVDFYLAPSEAVFQTRRDLHPLEMAELNEEYPSRRFEKGELLRYVEICREKLTEALAAETEQTMAGTSGFSRLKFSRAELYIYGLRHVQHHAGQMGAFLRRAGVETRWVGRGRV